MKALLLILLLTLAATGCGLSILRRTTVLKGSLLERFCFAVTIGLGIAAYGIYVLGLVGLLRFAPITLWWVILGVLGVPGWRQFLAEWKATKPERTLPTQNGWAWLFAVTSLCCGIFAVAACFRPPTGTEWDAIAYHLANPKVFLYDGRISILPTDHHSNFPFVMEMLFAVGLLYDGFPLANLFHVVMTFALVLAIVAFCARMLRRKNHPPTPSFREEGEQNAGYAAGILLFTTPLVLWEASVAYTDLGLALYATLATFAVVSAQSEREDSKRREWMILAGICAGFALGIKYLAILPLVVLIGYALIARISPRLVVQFGLIAALIGSPWYLKNAVQMQNPVYPYLAGLFPTSKYWSASRAKIYEGEQKSFGYPRRLGEKEKVGLPLALVQTPWRLTANAELYANPGNYDYAELFSGLVLGLCLCLVLLQDVPITVRGTMGIALVQVAAWFVNAQVGRYLLSVYPLLCVGAGYAAARISEKGKAAHVGVSALLMAQVGSLAYSVLVLPSHLSVSELQAILTSPDVAVALPRRRLDIFRASEWINANTEKNAGVILYEDVRGFYLDRPYLWGNGEHSSYIPYRDMMTGEELTRWFLNKDYRYIVINLRFAQQAQRDQIRLEGRELELLRLWYVESPAGMDIYNYRRLIQDALRKDLWRPVFFQNGVVVLKMEESNRE